MDQKGNIFNLLKPVELPKTSWDRVYDWVVGKARIIIIATQVIIAVTFFIKIYVDTTAKSKDDKIEQLDSELGFYRLEKEPLYRKLQTKGFDYRRIWNGSSDNYNILNEVYSYVQNPGISLSVRIEGKRVVVSGEDSLANLQILEESMKGSNTFSSVYISNLTQQQGDITLETGEYVLIAEVAQESLDRLSI